VGTLRRSAAFLAVGAAAAGAAGAAEPGFKPGAVYWGTTSQKTNIRIQIARNGRTAGVDAGILARCSGRGRYSFGFRANFHRNPARIRGHTMAVNEVDHNLPSDHQIPAAKVLRQYFAARTTDEGRALQGTYSANATLQDGRTCATGDVPFTAKIR
jgi:hypothetical protein